MFFDLMDCHIRCDDAACIAFKLKSTGATLGGRATADSISSSRIVVLPASTQQCAIDLNLRLAPTSRIP